MPEIRRLTSGPLHHFFGYYDVCPWNRAGTAHLALQTSFHERAPEIDNHATVGLVDTGTGKSTPVAETRAFNLRQGTMLNWIDVGSFRHPGHIRGDWRCDLHPRWSRDGRLITFDSVHEGSRQIYVADVSDLTN